LEQLALTDTSTGLSNRRAIELSLTRELSAAARHKFPLWLAIADIDHFKAINDTYGHDVGDSMLKGLADILKATLSIGVASIGESTHRPELSALLARADQALYVAKNKGRDRVEFATDS
jgi:PleD family two-component response regulator